MPTWLGNGHQGIARPLGIGLVGLMLACLWPPSRARGLLHARLLCPSCKKYLRPSQPQGQRARLPGLGRATGGIVVLGAVVGAMMINDMFAILKQTWIVPMTFAAFLDRYVLARPQPRRVDYHRLLRAELFFKAHPAAAPGSKR